MRRPARSGPTPSTKESEMSRTLPCRSSRTGLRRSPRRGGPRPDRGLGRRRRESRPCRARSAGGARPARRGRRLQAVPRRTRDRLAGAHLRRHGDGLRLVLRRPYSHALRRPRQARSPPTPRAPPGPRATAARWSGRSSTEPSSRPPRSPGSCSARRRAPADRRAGRWPALRDHAHPADRDDRRPDPGSDGLHGRQRRRDATDALHRGLRVLEGHRPAPERATAKPAALPRTTHDPLHQPPLRKDAPP